MVQASYTVQEWMAQIKAWEYIVVVLFIGVTLLFWRLLGRERRPEMRTSANPRRTRGLSQSSKQARAPGYWDYQISASLLQGCGSYQNGSLPCWLTRPMVEGSRVDVCSNCPVSAEAMKRLVQVAKGGRGGL